MNALSPMRTTPAGISARAMAVPEKAPYPISRTLPSAGITLSLPPARSSPSSFRTRQFPSPEKKGFSGSTSIRESAGQSDANGIPSIPEIDLSPLPIEIRSRLSHSRARLFQICVTLSGSTISFKEGQRTQSSPDKISVPSPSRTSVSAVQSPNTLLPTLFTPSSKSARSSEEQP